MAGDFPDILLRCLNSLIDMVINYTSCSTFLSSGFRYFFILLVSIVSRKSLAPFFGSYKVDVPVSFLDFFIHEESVEFSFFLEVSFLSRCFEFFFELCCSDRTYISVWLIVLSFDF